MLKDFWRQNSGSAGVMQLPRGGCHSSTATCKVVMTQWWSAQKILPFLVPLMPVCFRNEVLRHAQGRLTLVNWLLLLRKMFVKLSLVFIPSPDVTQLVLLLVKANSLPQRLSSQTMMHNKNSLS